jgi:protease-4
MLLTMTVGLSGCVYVSGGFNPFGQRRQRLQETTVSGQGRDKVLLLDVSGMITGGEGRSGLWRREGTVARMQEALRAAGEDKRIRAVVLRVRSPGGEVTASDTVFREIMAFKEKTGIPVIAALLGVATSGAYYVALAADEIVATPTTVTGSVGVILVGLNVEGLMGKLGIEDQTVKSGEYKDLLSPLRPTNPAERAIVQGVIDEMQRRFLTLVAARRPAVTPDNMRRIGDGRIFTASQAADLGMIDRVGYVDEAIDAAMAAAGVREARVVMLHRPSEYRENVYSRAAPPPEANPGGAGFVSLTLGLPQNLGPDFLYLWAPALQSQE